MVSCISDGWIGRRIVSLIAPARQSLYRLTRSSSALTFCHETPMSTRPVMVWIALAVLGSAATAPAQSAREALVRQSDIIFVGTVIRTGAVAAQDLPASPLTAVVRVDQVLEKPEAVGLVEGDSVTVQSVKQGSLKDGMRATFYT